MKINLNITKIESTSKTIHFQAIYSNDNFGGSGNFILNSKNLKITQVRCIDKQLTFSLNENYLTIHKTLKITQLTINYILESKDNDEDLGLLWNFYEDGDYEIHTISETDYRTCLQLVHP